MNDHDDKTDDRPGFLERLSFALLREPGSRTQLIEILRDAEERNLLDRDALDMIEGVLQVSEMQVREIMVPRAQMEVVDRNLPPEQFLSAVIESGHSRFPVVDGDKDRVVGILLAKELLRWFHTGRGKSRAFDLFETLRPVVVVPESKRLNVLLREFRNSRNHMAIVRDEYGGVSGLITIEDVLEQIVGDIRDEFDEETDDIRERTPGEYIVRATVALADFNERLKVALSGEVVETLGGWLLERLGRVPRRGEHLTVDGLRVEVMRADARRVALLRVTRVTPSPDIAVARAKRSGR